MIITNDLALRKECKDVTAIEVQNIIAKLEFELRTSKTPGVGLAANQIGIDAKVCIVRHPFNSINFANPSIVDCIDLMEFEDEGCLSYPNTYLLTKRYNEIFVKDLIHPAGVILTGIDAVIAQHEIDHLFGITMFDYQIKRPLINQYCWCKSGKKYKKCHAGKIIKIRKNIE